MTNDIAPITSLIRLKPKQKLFVEYYYSVSSDTFGNVYQSALKAGMSNSYARTLTTGNRNLTWLADARKYMTTLSPEHIKRGLEQEALSSKQPRDRIRSLELLAKMHGLFIERTQSDITVNFTNSVPRPVVDITGVEEIK